MERNLYLGSLIENRKETQTLVIINLKWTALGRPGFILVENYFNCIQNSKRTIVVYYQ